MESLTKHSSPKKPIRLQEGTWRYDLRRNWQIYLLFIPVAIYFITFHYAPLFGLAFFNHLGGTAHHIFNLVKIADFTKKIKAESMKGLYFNKICGVADEFHQPLLELGGGGP